MEIKVGDWGASGVSAGDYSEEGTLSLEQYHRTGQPTETHPHPYLCPSVWSIHISFLLLHSPTELAGHWCFLVLYLEVHDSVGMMGYAWQRTQQDDESEMKKSSVPLDRSKNARVLEWSPWGVGSNGKWGSLAGRQAGCGEYGRYWAKE